MATRQSDSVECLQRQRGLLAHHDSRLAVRDRRGQRQVACADTGREPPVRRSTTWSDNVSGFNVNPTHGRVEPDPGLAIPDRRGRGRPRGIVITPNQPPTAAFSPTTLAPAGQASSFSANASSDTDGGTIVRYDWDFGDGSTLPDGGPNPTAHLRPAWHVHGPAHRHRQRELLDRPDLHRQGDDVQRERGRLDQPGGHDPAGPGAAQAPQCIVPDVKGKKKKKAQAAIVAANCTVGAVKKKFSKKVKKKKVIKTKPAAGTDAARRLARRPEGQQGREEGLSRPGAMRTPADGGRGGRHGDRDPGNLRVGVGRHLLGQRGLRHDQPREQRGRRVTEPSFISGAGVATDPLGVAVNGNNIYWSHDEGTGGSIGRAGIDGSTPNPTLIATDERSAGGVGLDAAISSTGPTSSSAARAGRARTLGGFVACQSELPSRRPTPRPAVSPRTATGRSGRTRAPPEASAARTAIDPPARRLHTRRQTSDLAASRWPASFVYWTNQAGASGTHRSRQPERRERRCAAWSTLVPARARAG